MSLLQNIAQKVEGVVKSATPQVVAKAETALAQSGLKVPVDAAPPAALKAPVAATQAPAVSSAAATAPNTAAGAAAGCQVKPTDNISLVFTAIISLFGVLMVALTLLVSPIAIRDLLSYSSSRVGQYNKMQKGDMVLIKDSLEKTVLSYSKAKNTDEERFNVYQDVVMGKLVLQIGGYALLAFIVLAFLIIFININQTVAGSNSNAKDVTGQIEMTTIFKPLIMAAVTGVLYWAFIKFIYINLFERNILEQIIKAQEVVNAFNNRVLENISDNTTVMNYLNLDNESEFKKYIATLTDKDLVIKAITHFNIYAYYRSSINGFSTSDIRKKLVGTLPKQTDFSDWISVGCSKIIKNQFYDMDFIFNPAVSSSDVENGLMTAMSQINQAKSEMKSDMETLIPKFGSYLMQRMIFTLVMFVVALLMLFVLYGKELAGVIEFVKGFFSKLLDKVFQKTISPK